MGLFKGVEDPVGFKEYEESYIRKADIAVVAINADGVEAVDGWGSACAGSITMPSSPKDKGKRHHVGRSKRKERYSLKGS
ncbi:hypothetical protein L1987_87462 [Smallanthus sonchifolius]|nr:hypothetical protein L1987_87462 [Smallanthus sonchifolius]